MTDNSNIHRISGRLNDEEYERFQLIKLKLKRKTGNDTLKDLIKIYFRYEELIQENSYIKQQILNKENTIKEIRNSYEELKDSCRDFYTLLENMKNS